MGKMKHGAMQEDTLGLVGMIVMYATHLAHVVIQLAVYVPGNLVPNVTTMEELGQRVELAMILIVPNHQGGVVQIKFQMYCVTRMFHVVI